MYSACCSVEEGEGKQLNFIQHDAGLLSLQHILSELSHLLMISAKAPLLPVSSAKSKFQRRRPWLSFIKH